MTKRYLFSILCVLPVLWSCAKKLEIPIGQIQSAPQPIKVVEGTLSGVVTTRICGGAIPLNPPPGFSGCSTNGRSSDLKVESAGGTESLVEIISTDSAGNYSVNLPIGTYLVSSDEASCNPENAGVGASPPETCPLPVQVVVKEAAASEANFEFVILAP